MKSPLKLLAIVGSQRKNGNSYMLAEKTLKATGANYEIIQLVDKNIMFCTHCEKCLNDDCILDDDLNGILKKMKAADGIIFVVPKYLFVASKFISFLERLDIIRHIRTHEGYQHTAKNPDYRLFPEKQPFCLFVTSGTGKIEKEILKIVAEYIEFLGLKLVPNDKSPFLGVSIKAGDAKGEVLANEKGTGECEKLAKKLVRSIKR